jgi:hypothetical protein
MYCKEGGRERIGGLLEGQVHPNQHPPSPTHPPYCTPTFMVVPSFFMASSLALKAEGKFPAPTRSRHLGVWRVCGEGV